MVSVGRPALAATVRGCANVFGWIVATLLHHTRDRKVDQKLLDVNSPPIFEVVATWVRSEWNSGSILCRPPLLELDTCACIWYTLNTPAHLVGFGPLDEKVHALDLQTS